jgi:streptogramin lyase
VITGDALNAGAPSVTGLAFDPSGDLWVATPTAQKVLRYAAGALRASGSPAPVDAITNVKALRLAFDAAGNLWATADGNEVIEFAAARLVAPITTAPDVVLTAKTPAPVITPHQGPSGLAFDASNQLWVAYNGSSVVRFTPAERAASADVTPAVQITLSVVALAEGLAFDESGGLWFAYSQGKLARLAADQLAASGTITPSTVIESTSISSGDAVALYPAPANVPVFGKP